MTAVGTSNVGFRYVDSFWNWRASDAKFRTFWRPISL